MTPLRLASFEEVLDELVRLEQAPGAAIQGRWTLPQALLHCAQSIEMSMTGYPVLRSGLFRATVGALVKRRFLAQGRMSHDRQAPLEGAPDLPATATVADAITDLRRAIEAFGDFGGVMAPHPAYGPCSKREYEKLHAMHVADHLSVVRHA
jgi:uncharacterized protein DUF1569